MMRDKTRHQYWVREWFKSSYSFIILRSTNASELELFKSITEVHVFHLGTSGHLIPSSRWCTRASGRVKAQMGIRRRFRPRRTCFPRCRSGGWCWFRSSWGCDRRRSGAKRWACWVELRPPPCCCRPPWLPPAAPGWPPSPLSPAWPEARPTPPSPRPDHCPSRSPRLADGTISFTTHFRVHPNMFICWPPPLQGIPRFFRRTQTKDTQCQSMGPTALNTDRSFRVFRPQCIVTSSVGESDF